MADYNKATNYAVKDTLPIGNPSKVVRGTEIDAEFSAIATAVNSKANSAGDNATGTWPISVTGSASKWTTPRTETLTGDVSGSATVDGSANWILTTTLATVNANVGSFGSSSAIPVLTVNAKGLVTGVGTATVAGGQYYGTAAVKAIAYNADTIAENITIPAGQNGLSAGPVTINTGFTVTVDGNWSIV